MTDPAKTTAVDDAQKAIPERWGLVYGCHAKARNNVAMDWLADCIEQLGTAEAQLQAYKVRGDGHAETLRAIAKMEPDAQRMRQWAKDGLSGYTEPIESTLLKLTNDLRQAEAQLRQEREAKDRALAAYDRAMESADKGDQREADLRTKVSELRAEILRLQGLISTGDDPNGVLIYASDHKKIVAREVAQLQTTISQQAAEIERLKEFEWMYKELCK